MQCPCLEQTPCRLEIRRYTTLSQGSKRFNLAVTFTELCIGSFCYNCYLDIAFNFALLLFCKYVCETLLAFEPLRVKHALQKRMQKKCS